MAKAKKLPSGSWRVQVYSHTELVYDKSGKPKEKRVYESFTSADPSPAGRKEAEFQAAQFAKDKDGRSKSKLTLGEALDKYIESRSATRSPRTISNYEGIRKNYLQCLMGKNISRITQEDIQKAVNYEALKLSPKTIRDIHGLVSAVFKQYRPGFALDTALPALEKPDLYIPSDEEVKALLNDVRGSEMELPILLSAFGPMRRGEISGLYDKDIKDNTVHVSGNMVKHTERRKIGKGDILLYGGQWLLKRPKNYQGDRYIKYPDYVKQLWQGKSGRIVDLHPDQITDRFRRLIKRIGLPHFRFHDLRHYSASIQHALGIPDAYIMDRGGWGNDAVLKGVYRHAMDSKQEEMNQIANQHFSMLSIANADDLTIELPEYDRETYTKLLYKCCEIIKTYNITDPGKNINNFNRLLEAILSDYGVKNLSAAAQCAQKEIINSYEMGKEELFLIWIPKWFDTIGQFY